MYVEPDTYMHYNISTTAMIPESSTEIVEFMDIIWLL